MSSEPVVRLPEGLTAVAVRPEPYVKVNSSALQVFLPSETLRLLGMPDALIWYVDVTHGVFILQSVNKEEEGAFKVSYIGNKRGAMITIPTGYRHTLSPGYYKVTDHGPEKKVLSWVQFKIQSKFTINVVNIKEKKR